MRRAAPLLQLHIYLGGTQRKEQKQIMGYIFLGLCLVLFYFSLRFGSTSTTILSLIASQIRSSPLVRHRHLI